MLINKLPRNYYIINPTFPAYKSLFTKFKCSVFMPTYVFLLCMVFTPHTFYYTCFTRLTESDISILQFNLHTRHYL